MTDWSKCPAVESVPGRVSGAWVFKDTRLPVSALFGNLAEGATVHDFIEWFGGVDEAQVRAVLEFIVQDLDAKVRRGLACESCLTTMHPGSFAVTSPVMASTWRRNAGGQRLSMARCWTGLRKQGMKS